MSTQAFPFAPESTDADTLPPTPPWTVLIVDDEESVHQITRLALRHLECAGRPIELVHAYSSEEAKAVFHAKGNSIALALVDIVMETEDAGFKLIEYIREHLNNSITRLVVRTGQPGQAPEEHVIAHYDINDYRAKTELTHIKLKTLMHSALRAYQDILALHKQRLRLEATISALREVSRTPSLPLLPDMTESALKTALGIDCSEVQFITQIPFGDSEAYLQLTRANDQKTSDTYTGLTAVSAADLPKHLANAITTTLVKQQSGRTGLGYTALSKDHSGNNCFLYLASTQALDQDELHALDLFCSGALATYQTLMAKDELNAVQSELICILGEAIEKRSEETGAHVRRVAEISAFIAAKYGEPDQFVESLRLAAPLHDIGKIAIPDAILEKPARLDSHEWEVMQQHTTIGEEMLSHSDKPLFRCAATIAGCHHERWDGQGYPRQLRGIEIPLEGRITAVADVFDALLHTRCYKAPWSLEETLDYFVSERGKHFDPELVDLLLANVDAVMDICDRFHE
ncbi:HD domain-containing phosphohydrolase [Neptunomonas sp. XY-337]|uniref:HD domain-containing phosphohydrolase n=1 Tax=Neptunomonas sp. XY-337 TaxID=2561897 RepID=UPI0010AA0C2C|nr:HD domain-containing phosphohydrolase [Neptunomonas sp. XY-337]